MPPWRGGRVAPKSAAASPWSDAAPAPSRRAPRELARNDPGDTTMTDLAPTSASARGPVLRLLSSEDVELVLAAALSRLSGDGIAPASAEARAALLAAGATEAGGGALRLDGELAVAAAARAPECVALGDRSGENEVVLKPGSGVARRRRPAGAAGAGSRRCSASPRDRGRPRRRVSSRRRAARSRRRGRAAARDAPDGRRPGDACGDPGRLERDDEASRAHRRDVARDGRRARRHRERAARRRRRAAPLVRRSRCSAARTRSPRRRSSPAAAFRPGRSCRRHRRPLPPSTRRRLPT